MKKVVKNVAKSICIVCLVLQVVSTIYLGLYNLAANKAMKDNDHELIQSLVETGQNMREEINSKSEEEGNKQIGELITFVPTYIRFNIMETILLFSIMIGSIIGIAMSIDERSNKKLIITYIVMYLVILLILVLYELYKYNSFDINSLVENSILAFIVYTTIYGLTIFKKKIGNKKKVKIMNEELLEKWF